MRPPSTCCPPNELGPDQVTQLVPRFPRSLSVNLPGAPLTRLAAGVESVGAGNLSAPPAYSGG